MLSSNAPFNEFGQSMILRDIEQLYLSLNNAGTGSSGDGGTQDQASVADQNTGDSGGLPDLSGLATTDYVAAAIAAIPAPPSVTYPIAISEGGTGQTSQQNALNALSGAVTKHYGLFGDGTNVSIRRPPAYGTLQTSYTSGSGNYAVPAGVYFIAVLVVGGGGGKPSATDVTASNHYVAASSGGSPTTLVTNRASSGAGGSGGKIWLFKHVTPGDVLAYVVGAGGGDDTNGGSSSFSGVTAYGGEAGQLATTSGVNATPGRGGEGGTTEIGSNLAVPMPGTNGGDGMFGTSTVDTPHGGRGILISSTKYGSGGYISNAATGGFVGVFY